MPWDKTTTFLSAALVLASQWPAAAAQSVAPSSPATTAVSRINYADGVYTATGWYGGLPSSITVTLTLAQGVIKNVKAQTHATDPTSLDLQRRFAAAVPKVVVGKPIGAVKVGKLAGSSGTPDGFNDALQKIKVQATR